MIKKISLILLSICLFLSFNMCAVGAESAAAEITSPLSGKAVGEDFSEISFNAPVGSFVSLSLDGEEIFSGVSEGGNSVTAEELSFGEHIAVLKAVVGDEIEKDSVKFTKEKKISKTIDIETFRDFGTYEAGVDKDGNKVYAFPKKFPGKDGSEDGSFGYIIENLDGRIITKGSLAHDIEFKEFAENMKDKVTLSFDFKINNAYYFEFEMKNGDGGWLYPGGKMLFRNDYSIGTTGKKFPNNEWMAMEIVFDVPKQTIAIFIDGEEVIKEYKSDVHLRGLQMFRFLHCPRPGVETQSYMVDNFKLITENRYTGFSDVSYKAGDVFVDAFDGEITEEFCEVRFKSDMVFDTFSSDFTAKCFADGREVAIESISEEVVENEETGLREEFLVLKLKHILSGESDLEFSFENITSDGEKVTFEKNIYLYTGTFGIDSMEYFANGKPCISNGQLKEGDTLKAKFNFKNYVDEKAVCVVSVYDGGKLISLSAKTSDAASCEVETVLPKAENGYRTQCFILDGYKGRMALSNNKTIGGSND